MDLRNKTKKKRPTQGTSIENKLVVNKWEAGGRTDEIHEGY